LDSEERITLGYCLSFWKNKLDWKQKQLPAAPGGRKLGLT
jgi:hypothetical protein